MVEYPIQKRWPYRPRISRVPSVKHFSTVLWYTINFYDKSADYIRAWIAYAIHLFSQNKHAPLW